MQDQDVIREFLVESHENLSRLDQEIVALEKRPKDSALLASVFRTFHTIKGTCGFLAFSKLEGVAHQAENALSMLRAGKLELDRPLVSIILESMDAIRKILSAIEATGQEGPEVFSDLIKRLQNICNGICETTKTAADADSTESNEERRADGELPKSSEASVSNIRVGVGLLDKLMDLVGELVLTRNQILQFNAEREDPALNATSQRLNLITSELQEGVMKTRMQPIGTVWNKLPRVVRDMAVMLGKQIRLEMDGAGTELDRTIIEAIKDPLVHLVRNSCDHGIEASAVRVKLGKPAEGKLTLRAYHEGGQVNIEISDDGAGIDIARVRQSAVDKGFLRLEQAEKLNDREVMNLLFQPGFSTAPIVTNLSGRGVGMDVVKAHIEKIGGVVDIVSRLGEGATIKLKIPLTLAIIPGLVITSGIKRSGPRSGAGGGECFVIPQVSLVELIRLEDQGGRAQIESIHGTPVYRRRGSLLPIAYLNEVLGLESGPATNIVNIVVLQAEDRQFGLVVDGIADTQEIVVKPLSKQLKGLSMYAGATIMGDGRVALILDVLGIGQRSGVLLESRDQSRALSGKKTETGPELQRLLLFRAGSFHRLAVPLSLVARLEEFPSGSVEHASGRTVVQYRNRILQLVSLKEVLEAGCKDEELDSDPLQVVVFNDGDRSVGIVVDQILDVAEEAVTVRQKSSRKGLLGSAVIGKRVTDFVDLNYVLRSTNDTWMQSAGEISTGRRILVVESSAFSRGLIRSGLEMAGHRVLEAVNQAEALRILEQEHVDVAMVALDLPPSSSAGLLAAIRKCAEWRSLPVIALSENEETVQIGELRTAGFQECHGKHDRDAMLESIARLASALVSEASGATALLKES